MMLGATRAGCAAELHKELAESQGPLRAWLGRQMPKMPPKAYRWVAEMEEIGVFVDGIPDGRAAYQGFAQLYEHIATAQAAARKPDDAVAQLDAFCAMESGTAKRKTA